MNKNNIAETAKNGQTAQKVPTGKVKTTKSAEARRKAREEQFRNFRINALRRRCKRMGIDDEKTEELVKKLIEQMNAPKEYSILIMLAVADNPIMKEALAKANIKYKYHGDTYFSIDGDQNVLAKIREIAPPSAKIYPYAKKMESVIPKDIGEKKKTPTNNTAEKKAEAKAARKTLNKNVRAIHKKRKGKAFAKQERKISLSKRKKLRKAKTVQMKSKKASEGSKTLKKAA